MIRKISRIVQAVRDIILLVLSIVFISTSIGPGKEASNYLFAGICAVIFTFAVLNIALNGFKFQKKKYFLRISLFQLCIGLFLLILFFPFGIIIVGFNLIVLVSLWEKKTPEELLKHPKRPLTKQYRICVGAGLIIMCAAMFISWLSSLNLPLINVYLRTADLNTASQIVTGTGPIIAGIFALLLTPVILGSGLLGLYKRIFALISGILSLVVGIVWIIIFTTIAGPGSYVLIVGGIFLIVAFFKMK